MKKKPERLLTGVELEMMGILWRRGSGTVNDVLEALPPSRKLAYTSVSTILRILEQKGVLKSHKEGRGHVYASVVKKSDYESKTLRLLVDNVFDGEPTHLVARLVEAGNLSEEDLEAMRKLLGERGE